jgi:ATP-dependent Zn protease
VKERDADRKATSYHEAGHVVMGHLVGRNAESVTIVRNGHAAGMTHFEKHAKTYGPLDDSPEKKKHLRALVLTELAGTVAHDLLCPDRARDGGDADDEKWAKQHIGRLMTWSYDHDRYLDKLKDEAQKLLKEHWTCVEAIATALLAQDELSREQIVEILRSPAR